MIHSQLVLNKAEQLSIERIALKPLDDKPFGDVKPRFGCRVAFRFLSGPGVWFASCRGKNWQSGDGNKMFRTTQAAIEWLEEEST